MMEGQRRRPEVAPPSRRTSSVEGVGKPVLSPVQHRSTSITITRHSGGGDPSSLLPNLHDGSPLKRSFSWRKFKDTVKDTVNEMVHKTVGNNSGPEATTSSSSRNTEFLCENLTPDVEEKLHKRNSIAPPASQMDFLEKQADAAFEAAAKLPPPMEMNEVLPQIVVTADSTEKLRLTPETPKKRPLATREAPTRGGGDFLHEAPQLNRSLSSSTPNIATAAPPQPTERSSDALRQKQKAAAVLKIRAAINSAQVFDKERSASPAPGPAFLNPAAGSKSRSLSVSGPSSSQARGADDHGRRMSVTSDRHRVHRSGSVKKPKPKPMIWEHFDPVPNSSQHGRCKECHMTVSCKYNTGQFVRHLQVAHMEVYRRYQSKIQSEWARSIAEKNVSQP